MEFRDLVELSRSVRVPGRQLLVPADDRLDERAVGRDLAGVVDAISCTGRTSGPLLVHPGPQAWHVLESTNLHKVNGKYNLFLTEQNAAGSSYLSAPNLTGPWNFAERQPFDAGHATEVFQLGGQWMLSRHTTFTFAGAPRYVIKFDDLDWNTVGKPIIRWLDPLAGWTTWSGDAFYLQPTFWDNSAARGSQPSDFGGNSWVGTAELFTGPLQVGYPGLAAGDEPRGSSARHRSRSPATAGLPHRRRQRHRPTLSGPVHGGRFTLAAARHRARLRRDARRGVGRERVAGPVGVPRDRRSVERRLGHVDVDEIVESEVAPTDAGHLPGAPLALHQNVPNPFNPTTRIQIDLPSAGRTRLAVFDVRGRLVRELLDARLPGGPHTVFWDGTRADGGRAASGLYYSRLRFENQPAIVRSMVLLK